MEDIFEGKEIKENKSERAWGVFVLLFAAIITLAAGIIILFVSKDEDVQVVGWVLTVMGGLGLLIKSIWLMVTNREL